MLRHDTVSAKALLAARRGGDRGIRAMLHGLKLSEEQRDKVFAVLHAQRG